MKFLLPEALQTHVTLGKRRYRLKPTTANVIRVFQDLENPMLSPTDRVKLACWRLYAWPRPKDAQAAVDAAFALLNEPSPYKHLDDKQSLDITQDAAMIYAAFRQQYGINLMREVETLDWREFTALLGALTDDTAMGGIMGIRTMDIPKRNQHNGEDIKKIQKNKTIFALTNSKKQSFEEGIKNMAMVLASIADDSDGGEDDG